MWDNTPWFVGGGAQHSPEVARLLAYAATAGAEGVVTPGDLKVQALSVPGGSVRVAPGAALVRSRASGGDSQSYVARNPSEDTVAIAATGSGAGRTDLIVAQVEDPFMAGEPWQGPTNPAVGPYVFTRVISNVPAGTTLLQQVPGFEGRSAVTLARVTLPASTGTVTAAMITDLRKVARPRSLQVTLSAASSGGPSAGAVDPLNTTGFVAWPDAATWAVEVPEWATHVQVRGDVVSYVLKVANTTGQVRAKLFGAGGVAASFDENWTGGPNRGTLAFASSFTIPTASRGTTQTLVFEGLRSAGGGTGYIDADLYTSSLATVVFSERSV